MRINKYIALSTGMSRRAADTALAARRVSINGVVASIGSEVHQEDIVVLDNTPITPAVKRLIMLNKPIGYVSSRQGQGRTTIYDLLPIELRHLKPVGRLDKDSSGLLLLTNDGTLAHELTHPSFRKKKVYEVELDKPLAKADKANIETGVKLEDGMSVLELRGKDLRWVVTIHEGRNRQIRRTFSALGYHVTKLHRISFGNFAISTLESGKFQIL